MMRKAAQWGGNYDSEAKSLNATIKNRALAFELPEG